jgi:carboxylate-amine ligase
MATTLNPARPFPGAGVYPLDSGHFDEAFAKTGTARPPYVTVIDALARHDLVELRERVRSNIEEIGLSFGPGQPMVVDPVPRVIDVAEWEALEAGLLQRSRALNAFLLDAYGDQRIFEEGLIPHRLLETSQGYEPLMRGLLDPEVPPATVAGMDLIRDAEGELLVLEDNLRMPSGATYAIAVREAVGPEFGPAATAGLRRPDGYVERLGEAIRAAAPAQHAAEPVAAILSDGPESGAYYEHERLGRELSLPVVTPSQLSSTRGRLHAQIGRKQVQLDVVYRRLDEDRLTDRGGALTELGDLLAPALRSGRLRCVNAIGTGLADDKLAHAYVEAMVRFYLGEEPLLRSVPSYDLSDPEARDEVMGRLDQLVIKPRDGFGGHGVTIMPLATEGDRRKTIGLVRRRPERFVAQELVPLSTHPTVVGAGIAPRRVDLRPYVLSPATGEPSVMQGGLTRYAKAADEMVVNSSQGGGSKDTWVLGPPTDLV